MENIPRLFNKYLIYIQFCFKYRFTKNLSPDKINLSTLKGEGELSNLELDEAVLMELLDLPTWMKLSKAVCNRLSIKVFFKIFNRQNFKSSNHHISTLIRTLLYTCTLSLSLSSNQMICLIKRFKKRKLKLKLFLKSFLYFIIAAGYQNKENQ